jgi:glycerophosphoryl diester phosphodiesterase
MWKPLLAALVVTALLTQPASAGTSPDVLVAHRGFAGDAQVKYGVPENSIPAWDKAIRLAQRNFIVDLDARYAADGMIVMHDADISRTTNRSGLVSDLTLAYITGAFLELPIDRDGNGNDDNTIWHPPSVIQALDYLKGQSVNGVPVKISVELKGSNWDLPRVTKLKDALISRGLFTSRVNVHSFSLTYAKYAHDLGFPNVGYVAPSAGPLPSIATVKAVGNNVLVKYSLITTPKLNEYNNAGIKVWIWTLRDEEQMGKVWNLGKAYAWCTNDLVLAQDFLAEKEAG